MTSGMRSGAGEAGRATATGLALWLAGAADLAGQGLIPADLQLVQNLTSFPDRVPLGDPGTPAAFGEEGPKGVVAADFDGDGLPDVAVSNLDGTVALLFGRGGGDLEAPVHLATGARSLRGITAADFDGDGAKDLAVAAPFDAAVFLFLNDGGGTFSRAIELPAWPGARDLVPGDFDGDGHTDLAVAGPGAGLRHYRGLGNGAFTALGDLPELAPPGVDFPRPVYAMGVVRSGPGPGARDLLVVTHAESDRLWLLGTVPLAAGAGWSDPAAQAPPAGWEASPLLMTEFNAANRHGLSDIDGDEPDWVEIFNRSDEPVDLAGWALTDSADRLDKWVFPSVSLSPGRYLVVFASGKDRAAPGGAGGLHTNFKLSADGEYLALVDPGGAVAHAFAPVFPPQATDVSYGLTHAGAPRYFGRPSPGGQNNAGVVDPADLELVTVERVGFDPAMPAPGEAVEVTVVFDAAEPLAGAWYGYAVGVAERFVWLDPQGENRYRATLPPGAYTPGMTFRVAARTPDGRIVPFTNPGQEQPPEPGALGVLASLPGQPARSLDVGHLLVPEPAEGEPAEAPRDLVTANRDRGTLEVRRGNNYPHRFDHPVHQRINVPGGPRSVHIADLDGDGWNDLVVVLRGFDKVVTFRNDKGVFSEQPAAESATGVSPRAAALADFNEDGRPDAAVINRISDDLSLHLTLPGAVAFSKLDQVFPTDGEVTGLAVFDVNGDGRADVVQVHGAAADSSVRLSGEDGALGDPEYYPFDGLPLAPGLADCNGDDVPDLVVPDLAGDGAVEVRLGDGDGGFGPALRFLTNLEPAGTALQRGLIGLEAADLDGDEDVDLAALFYDCQIGFFKGGGDGTFEHTETHDFVTEPRVPLPEDFNQDGIIDLAGVGYGGELVVIENLGDLLEAETIDPDRYPVLDGRRLGARDVRSADVNSDGDPDLLVGTGHGVMLYLGRDGVRFERAEGELEMTGFPVSGLAVADFDGNGTPDIAVSCKERSCLTLLAMDENGTYRHALTVDVPAGDFLATGDVDGDGLPDLVGAGDVLWVALSGREVREGGVAELPARETLKRPVFNELLAINNGTPLESDEGRLVDFVELYNGAPVAVELSGWTIDLEPPGAPVRTYAFPAVTQQGEIGPGEHLLIYFADGVRSAFHTGFKLPGGGATLVLRDAGGAEVDRVTYPPQQANVAYGRFADGVRGFTFNRIPSPGRPNRDSGPVEPVLDFEGFDLDNLAPGAPLRFFARGRDDLGIVGVVVRYQRLDLPGAEPGQLVLFDDGRHGDGARLDGLYSNALEGGFPAGAEIAFFLEATDLTGQVQTAPGGAGFGGDEGGAPEVFSIGFAPGDPGGSPLQIDWVVADNRNGREDEEGNTPDYVLVVNRGDAPATLDGVALAQAFRDGPGEVFEFPAGLELPAGGEIIVYLDGRPGEGPFHAPFAVAREGERLLLLGTGEHGARILIDRVDTPALGSDEAFRRVAGTDVWERAAAASPRVVLGPGGNWTGAAATRAGQPVFAHVFATEPGFYYRAEYSPDGGFWRRLPEVLGDGRPAAVWMEGAPGGIFRLEVGPVLVEIPVLRRVAAVAYARAAAEVTGEVEAGEGPVPVVVYYGPEDGGTDPAAWGGVVELGLQAGRFAADIAGLEPGTAYFARVFAGSAEAGAWSVGSLRFTTAEAGAPAVTVAAGADATIHNAALAGAVEGGPVTVMVYWGEEPGGTDPAAWANVRQLDAVEGAFSAVLENLDPGVDYAFRISASNAVGTVWSPGGSVFRTQTMLEALREGLLVSEVMADPERPPPGALGEGFVREDLQFIEFYNAGRVRLDLGQVQVAGAIVYDFGAAVQTVLEPGEFLVLARNRAAAEHRFGPGLAVAGEWFNPLLPGRLTTLDADGERLALSYGPTRETVLELTYPPARDAAGHSLQRVDLGRAQGDGSGAAPGRGDWVESWVLGGSPGRAPAYPELRDRASPGGDAEEVIQADFDGDGLPDLAVLRPGVVEILVDRAERGEEGEEVASYVSAQLAIGPHGRIHPADFDGDGDLDFIAVPGPGRIAAPALFRLAVNGDVVSAAPDGQAFPGMVNGSAAWADFDRDGDPDLVLAGLSDGGGARLFLNEPAAGGGRQLVPAGPAGLGEVDPGALVPAWFNLGGGAPGLVLGGRDRSTVYRWEGGGFARVQVDLPGIGAAGTVGFADVEGDGDEDLLLSGTGGDGLPWAGLFRQEAGRFVDLDERFEGVVPGAATWGDDDGDGRPDVLLSGGLPGGGGPRITLFRNRGPGLPGARIAWAPSDLAFPQLGAGPARVAWVDVDAGAAGGAGAAGRREFVVVDPLRGVLVWNRPPATGTSPAGFDQLRVAEVMFHAPVDPAIDGAVDDDSFDFIEIVNRGAAAVDLAGLHLVGGVGFDFGRGAIPVLGPGGRVLVVADRAAFEGRYGAGLPVAGEYWGRLSNRADHLVLAAAPAGGGGGGGDGGLSAVHEVAYTDDDVVRTDGEGRSLLVEETAEGGVALSVGTADRGSPGAPDPAGAPGFSLWAEAFGDPSVAAPHLDPDRDGRVNLAEFLHGTDPLAADQPLVQTATVEAGGLRFPAVTYRHRRFVPGQWYHVRASDDLRSWRTLVIHGGLEGGFRGAGSLGRLEHVPGGGAWADLTVRDYQPLDDAPRRFFRIEGAASPSPFRLPQIDESRWADTDGDGDDDLLLAGRDLGGSWVFTVFRNDPGAPFGFTESVMVPAPGLSVVATHWLDLDGDGHLDLLVSRRSPPGGDVPSTAVHRGGDGTFRRQAEHLGDFMVTSAAAGDADGDGRQDWLLSGQGAGGVPFAGVFLRRGDALDDYQVVELPDLAPEPWLLSWGDYEGDGDLDVLAVGEGGTTMATFRNAGDGTFTGSGASVFLTTVLDSRWADADGDGDLDTIRTRVSGDALTAEVFENRAGDLGAAFTHPEPPRTWDARAVLSVDWADVDRDGRVDLLVTAAGEGGGIGYFIGGLPRFPGFEGYPASGARQAHWADFDRDGDPDVLINKLGEAGRATLFLNDGGGRFVPSR